MSLALSETLKTSLSHRSPTLVNQQIRKIIKILLVIFFLDWGNGCLDFHKESSEMSESVLWDGAGVETDQCMDTL